MTNRIIFFFLIFSFTKVKAQEENVKRIKSINGAELTIVDSLSFRDNLQSSQYYIDNITQEAYTGKAVVYYGDKAYDSLTLSDGVKDGWQKLYSLMGGKEYELIHLYFYDQKKLFYVSYPVSLKFKTKSGFVRYHAENGCYFLEIIYMSSGKIIVKQSFQISVDKFKQKFKFSNLIELEKFFRTHYPIYHYCKQAGFFGEPEIE